MTLKVFKNPLINQASPVFTLHANIFFDEILWRIDFLSLQCFRATCQEACSKVEGVRDRQSYWKKLLVTYYPSYVQKTCGTIDKAVNPRLLFGTAIYIHNNFERTLKKSHPAYNLPYNPGYDPAEVSATIKTFRHFINSENWMHAGNTVLMTFVLHPKHYHYDYKFFSAMLTNMLKYGADINHPNAYGDTPLHSVVLRQEVGICKFMLENGANVNAQNENGWTPLNLAVLTKNIQLVEFLLNKGANVNAQEKGGWTSLHYAAAWNLPKIVSLLLKWGAKADIMSNNKMTPLDIVKAEKLHEIEKLFNSKGSDQKSETNNGFIVGLQNTIKGFFSRQSKHE